MCQVGPPRRLPTPLLLPEPPLLSCTVADPLKHDACPGCQLYREFILQKKAIPHSRVLLQAGWLVLLATFLLLRGAETSASTSHHRPYGGWTGTSLSRFFSLALQPCWEGHWEDAGFSKTLGYQGMHRYPLLWGVPQPVGVFQPPSLHGRAFSEGVGLGPSGGEWAGGSFGIIYSAFLSLSSSFSSKRGLAVGC